VKEGNMNNPVTRWFNRRKSAYKSLFNVQNKDALVVLTDLKRFCRHNQSTFHTDTQIQAYQNGKRDVLERIIQFVNLSDEQINKIKED
jgi:predicted alpha/beta hydrolase